ncbi:hypothetical protein D3C76_1479900 [compost metagenome]
MIPVQVAGELEIRGIGGVQYSCGFTVNAISGNIEAAQLALFTGVNDLVLHIVPCTRSGNVDVVHVVDKVKAAAVRTVKAPVVNGIVGELHHRHMILVRFSVITAAKPGIPGGVVHIQVMVEGGFVSAGNTAVAVAPLGVAREGQAFIYG